MTSTIPRTVAFSALVEARRAMDGLPASEHDQRPFDFAEWLQGVKDGLNPAQPRLL